MVGHRFSALALLLSCAFAPAQAGTYDTFDRDCWDRNELEALKVQRFKTMLLVSMLNCRDSEPGIAEDYNRFVRANRDLIARNQSTVRQRFVRAYGAAAGLNAYSRFETSLGNQYSDADFDYRRCASVARDAQMAGYVSEGELMDLVQSVPEDDRLAVCPQASRYASRSLDWAPPAPRAPVYAEPAAPAPAPILNEPAVETAQNEWPDLAPIEPEGPARAIDPNEVKVAEAAPPPPQPMAERAAEPVQMASVEVAVPAPVEAVAAAPVATAGPDRVRAVRDAAKALREALAALEAEEAAVR